MELYSLGLLFTAVSLTLLYEQVRNLRRVVKENAEFTSKLGNELVSAMANHKQAIEKLQRERDEYKAGIEERVSGFVGHVHNTDHQHRWQRVSEHEEAGKPCKVMECSCGRREVWQLI